MAGISVNLGLVPPARPASRFHWCAWYGSRPESSAARVGLQYLNTLRAGAGVKGRPTPGRTQDLDEATSRGAWVVGVGRVAVSLVALELAPGLCQRVDVG